MSIDNFFVELFIFLTFELFFYYVCDTDPGFKSGTISMAARKKIPGRKDQTRFNPCIQPTLNTFIIC